MKRKNKLLFLTVLLLTMLLSNCFEKKIKSINILTDEPALFEIIDDFNIKNDRMKVKVDFFTLKNTAESNKNIFKYFEESRGSDYDIIIGKYNPELLINYSLLSEVNALDKILSREKEVYPFVSDYISKHDQKLIPFDADFFVISARKEIVPKGYLNSDEISLEDFFNLVKRNTKKENESQYNSAGFAFIPSVSKISELDFYFLFYNNLFNRKNENIVLDKPKTEEVFTFYNSFDDKYNFGKDTIVKYFERYKNVNKNFYMKQKIFLFDIIPVSEALSNPDDFQKIFFIKELRSLALSSRAVALPKSSINKNEAVVFLEYLFSEKTQSRIFSAVSGNSEYYKNFFIPLYKNIMPDVNIKTLSLKKVEDYASNLKYPEFYNNNFRKKFLIKYFRLKDALGRGVISEKDFTDKLALELK